ncbi:hypothetical protein [Loigolactobacillus rennini]|nr:hypothetical protein [Loigolactobacillus rennini]
MQEQIFNAKSICDIKLQIRVADNIALITIDTTDEFIMTSI